MDLVDIQYIFSNYTETTFLTTLKKNWHITFFLLFCLTTEDVIVSHLVSNSKLNYLLAL